MATCDHCGKEGAKSACGGCQAARYCGRDCLLQGWPAHKSRCAALPKALRAVAFRAAAESDLAGGRALASEGGESFREFDLGDFLAGAAGGSRVRRVTSAEFVQIVAAAERGGGRILGEGPLAPWVSLKIGRGKHAPAFFRPEDDTAAEALRDVYGSPGVWLAGPDRRGRYLGLGTRGPARASLEEWRDEVRRVAESAPDDSPLGLSRAVGDYDHLFLSRGPED